MTGQQLPAVGVELALPDHMADAGPFQAEFKAADSGEEGADSHRASVGTLCAHGATSAWARGTHTPSGMGSYSQFSFWAPLE